MLVSNCKRCHTFNTKTIGTTHERHVRADLLRAASPSRHVVYILHATLHTRVRVTAEGALAFTRIPSSWAAICNDLEFASSTLPTARDSESALSNERLAVLNSPCVPNR